MTVMVVVAGERVVVVPATVAAARRLKEMAVDHERKVRVSIVVSESFYSLCRAPLCIESLLYVAKCLRSVIAGY